MNHAGEQLERIQQIGTEILREVVKICDRHEIQYYVVAGTMLGAVRHKGFIPWDDDIDLLMTRENRERFIAYAQHELPDHLAIDVAFEEKRASKYMPDLTRIYHKNYSLLDMSMHPFHLAVDVHTLLGMPKNKLARSLHYYRLMFCKVLTRISRPEIIGNSYWKNKKMSRRLIIYIVQNFKFSKVFRYSKQMQKLKEAVERYPIQDSEYAMLFPSPYGQNEIVPKAYYGDGAWGEFEGIKVRLPSQHHELLTRLYGDYMTPPPQSERQGTHIVQLVYNDDVLNI